MKIMHDCPHCGLTIGLSAWRLARVDTYYCNHCELPVRPTHELRKAALRLILARRRAEQEFAVYVCKPEAEGPEIKERPSHQHVPLPAE